MSQFALANPGSPGIRFNPFGDSAFGSPWTQIPADVSSINDASYRAILNALAQVRLGAKGPSIVITGQPGSGKTHLLARLRKRLALDASDGRGQTAYVYVRCHASSVTLWRHVREWLAADLLKQEDGNPSILLSLLQQHPNRLETVRSLSLQRVLQTLAQSRHVRICAAWLRGEALHQSDLDALAIGADKDDEERSRETEARDLVHGLLDFLAPTPVVLCFDQVEALQTYRGDEEGFRAIGALISDLHDRHSHVLLVSCLVAAFEDLFDRLPNKADRDRWLGAKFDLRPIPWDQAVQLVKSRLDSAPGLAAERLQHADQEIYPIPTNALQPLFEKTGLCLPRTLLQECKRLFEDLPDTQTPPRPKLSRQDFLQQEFGKNLNAARQTVARLGGDKTLGESLPWLLQNSGASPLPNDPARSQFAHLAFRNPAGAFAVLPCYCNANALTSRLKKAEQHWKPQSLGLRILRDPSVKVGLKGQEVLLALRNRGAQEINPLPEALAALQAIHNMVASARSGDFTQDGQGIGEQEVTDWALANLSPQLEKLRDALSGHHAPDPVSAKLFALLNERKILDAETAARQLSITMENLTACALADPMRFGVLAGPPLVFFQAIEGGSTEVPHA